MENTLIEQFGTSRYGAPRRYDTHHRGITALEYGQAVPVLVTTLEQLQQHGADAAVWRRLGRTGEQTLTAALDNPDGDALYRRQAARADADEEQRRAAEREPGARCASGAGRSSSRSGYVCEPEIDLPVPGPDFARRITCLLAAAVQRTEARDRGSRPTTRSSASPTVRP
ncbi:hypothetical protein [Streptomyces glaucescens]|uniref:hypothetical protein n=1 Tax=Streptomyces glaucescens TaxID=1907 RepID=UPI001FE4C0BA|nr:hypothetical protein [Streptomyces glaucescens]